MVKEDSAAAIRALEAMGVRTAMITKGVQAQGIGDHRDAGKAHSSGGHHGV